MKFVIAAAVLCFSVVACSAEAGVRSNKCEGGVCRTVNVSFTGPRVTRVRSIEVRRRGMLTRLFNRSNVCRKCR